MNKEWSNKNKAFQAKMKKDSFKEGIKELIELRDELMEEMESWKTLSNDDFSACPFINADGYHSKTIAYSIWHIMRIEDIVVNSLILNKEEILFTGNYQKLTNSPLITTGNELVKQEIVNFSKELNIAELYNYANAVKQNTDEWLKSLEYDDLKHKFTSEDIMRLKALHVVSEDESAIWLIDYWCGKDVKGLLQMPLSRHWIMHIEAAIRIKSKLNKL